MKFFNFNFLRRKKTEASAHLEESRYEDFGFRKIGDSENQKNLNQLSRDEQLKVVFSLWLKNGFAKRLIQLPIDFIVGEEMFTPEFKSKDDVIPEETLKQCSELVKAFIEKNKLNEKFERFATDLSLNGMLLLPCTNNPNGDVIIGFIDPSRIEKVITNPYDITEITSVKMKTGFMGNTKIFQIVKKRSAFDLPEEDQKSYDLLSGDAFFYAVNNVSNQPEGVSDLLADIDMIQKLYELLINVVDSTKLANMFVLDVEITGASADQIKAWRKANPIPTRPTRYVHNDKVKQSLAGTGIKAFNAPEVVRVIKNFILGNSSYPPMWFADGEDANRAIAIEQGTPVYKKLDKRQQKLVGILKDIYMYVIHMAVLSKEGFKLKKDDLESLIIEIKAPEIQIKNLDKITKSLTELTSSLEKAESRKWLTGKTIRKAFINFINLLGFDINYEAEESALENDPGNDPEPTDDEKEKMKLINPDAEDEKAA